MSGKACGRQGQEPRQPDGTSSTSSPNANDKGGVDKRKLAELRSELV